MEDVGKKRMDSGKILLIILTIAILGPLVFVGACFPLGYGAAMLGSMNFGIIFAIIIGLALAIFVVYKVIKKILRKK